MPDKTTGSPAAAVGIDLGATKTASVLITRTGEIQDSLRTATNASGDPANALETVVEHIRHYQTKWNETVMGFGIGTPGWHDPETGTITNAVNVGWEDFKIIEELQQRISIPQPVFHRTDAVAETLGEHYFGSAKNTSDFVYLGVGSGLGSGFFIGGNLVSGSSGMAGSIGHFGFGTSTDECVCGIQGCLEQKIGGIGLTNILSELAAAGDFTTQLKPADFTDHRRVLGAADENDALALAALHEMGTWLGAAASVYISLLNPQLIVIGGGLGKAAYNFIIPSVRKEAQKRTLKRYWNKLDIRKSTVTSSAAGAACLVWERFDRGGDDRE